MLGTLTVREQNNILYPDPTGIFSVTYSVNLIDGSKVASIGWGGKMFGLVTKDANNFLVSIQVLDEMSDSPELRTSLENIGRVI